jgi:uncharacterized protein (DUF2062 family)
MNSEQPPVKIERRKQRRRAGDRLTFTGRWPRIAAFYEKFISLHGAPASIARAISVGLWVAWFPIIGTHSVISALGGLIFRANLPAVYFGSWLCNPLTIPPMLWAEYKVGSCLIGGAQLGESHFTELTFSQVIHLGWGVLAPMLLGGAILGLANALLGYYPVKWLIVRGRARRAKAAAEKEAS